ncbi:MAG: hypothetical protein F9K40_16955 [Kofleriaceae bacterium]|nr:MAG: hypothetical protein F9K40_16955 [Kofleriaceae bacterium]MBZ0235148.1 hypothetical protein [Kofleriaceae bacterium]
MKKLVPAVFYQKRVDGNHEEVKRPERLELFDSELRRVVGGRAANTDSFSHSAGWADVLQADDCQG